MNKEGLNSHRTIEFISGVNIKTIDEIASKEARRKLEFSKAIRKFNDNKSIRFILSDVGSINAPTILLSKEEVLKFINIEDPNFITLSSATSYIARLDYYFIEGFVTHPEEYDGQFQVRKEYSEKKPHLSPREWIEVGYPHLNLAIIHPDAFGKKITWDEEEQFEYETTSKLNSLIFSKIDESVKKKIDDSSELMCWVNKYL